jgi:hypothetical protein
VVIFFECCYRVAIVLLLILFNRVDNLWLLLLREEARLTTKTNALLDANQQAYFLNFSANCWLGVRLEFAGTMIITFCALAAVCSRSFYANGSESRRHEFAGELKLLTIGSH